MRLIFKWFSRRRGKFYFLIVKKCYISEYLWPTERIRRKIVREDTNVLQYFPCLDQILSKKEQALSYEQKV